ncbi:hypothetical protein BG846_01972 [Streptomyces fradiae ATCC 10745 = DSM 40063]|uniref:Uncharacterized protein n=1 Tax=Streptomyces fradiae ATCC 10745 = DSM 40063 TaxID=1319510 RepID=A0A1Y2NXR8_STRFR|nr:hypothetical protein BG846_01972 [Streptomyces fradiae ATCC 10745 = DSM 40063]
MYAVSNTRYGTRTPPTSRLSWSGRAAKVREKYPETITKAGMWKAYTTMYSARVARLPSMTGSHA